MQATGLYFKFQRKQKDITDGREHAGYCTGVEYTVWLGIFWDDTQLM